MENKNVLAVVNGVEITDEIIDRTIEQFPPDRQAMFLSPEGRQQLIDQLINVELVNAYGHEIGIENNDLYRTQMEQAEKDIRFGTTMSEILKDVQVSDEEAKARYEADPSLYDGQESIGAKHILVSSQEQADEIKAKLDAGDLTFEEAAAQYSSCPSKEAGGDLGSFGKGMMVPEFESAAFEAPLNEVTDPVQTQFGYHLIKVYDKKDGSQASFEEVAEDIKNTMLQEKQVAIYNEKLTELREKYMDK